MLYTNKIKQLLNKAYLNGNSSISINNENISLQQIEELIESSFLVSHKNNQTIISY